MGFQRLEGDTAVLVRNGVYMQCDLYTRHGYLYAKIGGGFVRFNRDGSSSTPGVRLDEIDIVSATLFADKLGRIATRAGDGFRQLPLTDDGRPQPLAAESEAPAKQIERRE